MPLTWDNGSMALASVRVSCGVCEVEFLTRGPPVATGGGTRRGFLCPSCWLLLEPDATSDMGESTYKPSARILFAHRPVCIESLTLREFWV